MSFLPALIHFSAISITSCLFCVAFDTLCHPLAAGQTRSAPHHCLGFGARLVVLARQALRDSVIISCFLLN